jgi:metal transporter CNNM
MDSSGGISFKQADGSVPGWVIALIVICALVSAFFNAQNLAIMSLDTKNLEMIVAGPFETKKDEIEAARARKILPVRRRGNLALCTILLWIAAANSMFSIVLADVTNMVIGTIISVVVIVICGEIIP